MELIEGIRSRRSVRQFTDKPLDRELIKEIVEDARYAPSWKNTQITRYTYIDDHALMEEIADKMTLGYTNNCRNMKASAGIMVLSYITGKSGYEPDGSFSTSKGAEFEMFDAGCAAEAFCLAAHARGVGTVITGIFDEQLLLERLGMEGRKIACIIYMGWPKEPPKTKPRLSVDELLDMR